MAILKIRDENGEVYEIAALRGPQGPKGEDAYAKVKEYGYEGSEEDFYLAMSRHGEMPDKTLTKEGRAADAAVVGKKLEEHAGALEEQAAATEQRIAAANAALEAHTSDTDAHVTQEERERWNGAATTFWRIVDVDTNWEVGGIADFGQIVYVDGLRKDDTPEVFAVTDESPDITALNEKCLASVYHAESRDGALRLCSSEAIDEPFQIFVKVVR